MRKREFLTGALALGASVAAPANVLANSTSQAGTDEESIMDNIAKPAAGSGYSTAISGDGTQIAFETRGTGRPTILIGGALNTRKSDIAGLPMAELLSDRFTSYAYDRRGRGDSGEGGPYAVQREIEDIAALAEAAGEPVLLFGHSSGAALALEAAAADLPVAGAATYEPPYSMDAESEAESRVFTAELNSLIAEDRHADAVAFFMSGTGMPLEMVEQFKESPFWPVAVAMAPTLAHEAAVLRAGGDSYVPIERISRIGVPLLSIAGGDSPEWMRQASKAVADAAQGGSYKELAGENHMASPQVVSSVLKDFFGGI